MDALLDSIADLQSILIEKTQKLIHAGELEDAAEALLLVCLYAKLNQSKAKIEEIQNLVAEFKCKREFTRPKPEFIPPAIPIIEEKEEPIEDETIKKIYEAKDIFQMLEIERWTDVDDIDKAYKKMALKVHPDRNTSSHAQKASAILIAEFDKFRKDPKGYTFKTEYLESQSKHNDGNGVQAGYVNFDEHEGYGDKPGWGGDTTSQGFTVEGKRSYTWAYSSTSGKAYSKQGTVNPEGGPKGSLYADPKGEQAWLAQISNTPANAHQFVNGVYQTAAKTGRVMSKHGTSFMAKNSNY